MNCQHAALPRLCPTEEDWTRGVWASEERIRDLSVTCSFPNSLVPGAQPGPPPPARIAEVAFRRHRCDSSAAFQTPGQPDFVAKLYGSTRDNERWRTPVRGEATSSWTPTSPQTFYSVPREQMTQELRRSLLLALDHTSAGSWPYLPPPPPALPPSTLGRRGAAQHLLISDFSPFQASAGAGGGGSETGLQGAA